jgi:hypothetical protein
MGAGKLWIMTGVLEANVIAEDATHLRLDRPWMFSLGKSMAVKLVVTEASDEESDPYMVIPEQWRERTPKQRAAMIEDWARRHAGGAGLSDWEVSRDSIYD